MRGKRNCVAAAVKFSRGVQSYPRKERVGAKLNPQSRRGYKVTPAKQKGGAKLPPQLCGFNFAPPSTLRPFLCGVRKMRETKESKATHVTLFWKLSRNPDKCQSKTRRTNAQINEQFGNALFVREKMLTVFG